MIRRLLTALLAVVCVLQGCTDRASHHEQESSNASGNESAAHASNGARVIGDGAALESLRARMAHGDASVLTLASLALAHASGARDVTGDAADDERVERATLVTRQDDSAAFMIATTCGNAVLAALRWNGARWIAGDHVVVASGMQPGRCGHTDVRVEPVALSSDARREIALVSVSEDVTGESMRGPFLSVFQLRAHGELATLLADAPFGAMDDTTGATTTGEYLVVEDVPPPRDLHVAIRPGRPGPGGPPAREIVRRRYALHGARLEMVQQTTETVEAAD